MVEKGVRFVCVVSGGGAADTEWDAHSDIEENHIKMAPRPTSRSPALIKDLKRRGLLDSTIVLWGGEFGRSPESEKSKGRDHHNPGFSMWVAGGGFKGGTVYGATDAHRPEGRREARPLPRPPHHDAVPDGPRPGRAELPAPRPQGAPHRGQRRSTQRHHFIDQRAVRSTALVDAFGNSYQSVSSLPSASSTVDG